jgi:hypothetical protein
MRLYGTIFSLVEPSNAKIYFYVRLYSRPLPLYGQALEPDTGHGFGNT